MLYEIQKMNKNMRSILLIFLSITLVTSMASATNYGGIGGNITTPPRGSHIDVNLSHYYNSPTAVGNGQTYWYIAGFWFNQTEMLNLPSDSIMYGESPYTMSEGSSSGHHSDPASVPMPISPFVIIGFVGFVAIYLAIRYRK
jgi:hypothetical protein